MFDKNRLILVTNDDGITSKGIKALIEVAQHYGTVAVVAPNSPQSAMGHAITISQPLRLQKVDIFDGVDIAYACSGTPVDCVKLAIDKVLPSKPSLCLSGVNHGSNIATNVIYSGTMSAAMEAAMSHIPAIGFSLMCYSSNADMDTAKVVAHKIIRQVLQNGMAQCNLLNVNIPDVAASALKGIKICRQAKAYWKENYSERTDPIGRKYYWLSGDFINYDTVADNDLHAVNNNYVAVVPVQHDLTAYKDMQRLNEQWTLDV